MFLLKLAKSRPAWTLHAPAWAGGGPFPLVESTAFTSRVCQVSHDLTRFEVPTDVRTAQRLIGNAVPSALAELLGLEIRRQLLGERVEEDVSLLPSATRPTSHGLSVDVEFQKGIWT